MRRLLAVKAADLNYVSYYTAELAHDYEEAKAMIEKAEADGAPFDDLDLCVRDEGEFWEFVDWMEMRGTKYPFSIFDYKSGLHFERIRDLVRKRGFHFNS